MDLLADKTIFNYSIEFTPDPLKKHNAHVKQEIMGKIDAEIKAYLPINTWSGNNLFSPTSYDKKIELELTHCEVEYYISLIKVGSLDLKHAE